MSDAQNEDDGRGSAAAVPAKTEKKVTEKETVTMTDGRQVEFAGKRKMLKEVDVNGSDVSVRFDFRNGETRTFTVPQELLGQFAGHGASQKIGDETAGTSDLDDIIVAVDAIIDRLSKGEWSAAREEGDGFSGASVVIKAIAEVTGKTADQVKTFLQSKLDQAAAKGEKLTRQALYKSFRNPNSATGKVIQRMELEKASKSGVNSDDLLTELGATE